VLHVIPGDGNNGRSMIFARRQVASFAPEAVESETLYLSSRTDPRVVAREALVLRRLARRFQPDVIHAHYGTLTAAVCTAVSRIPVVITFRGSDLNPTTTGGAVRAFVARGLSQCAALRATRIVCVSAGLKERLLWRAARATVIPDGIDLGLFHPRPQAEARRALGWPSDDRVVVFNIGNDPEIKRPDLAQAAVGRARTARGDLRLHLIDGNEHPARIPLFLNAADCLLVTSTYEGSPNMVKEALACNLPVVSVDVGDVAERLAGVTPSRVVERSEAALAEALLQVIALGRRCNGFAAVRDLSLDCIAERVLAVYRQAMDSRPLRPESFRGELLQSEQRSGS